MSMTLEEAIKNREECLRYLEDIGAKATPSCVEAVRWSVKALKALRPITREQVEKVWRGEWQVCFEEWQNHRVEGEQCSKCGFQNYGPSNLYNFCPKCGSPMTDKAVDMVMERLEEICK